MGFGSKIYRRHATMWRRGCGSRRSISAGLIAVYAVAMCGHFALYSAYPKFAHRIGELRVDDPPLPRYNVAPGTWISAILRRSDDQQLALDDVWWAISRNGRGEGTAAEQRSYRDCHHLEVLPSGVSTSLLPDSRR